MGGRCYVLLKRRHDVAIRCRGDVPLRRLGDVLWRLRWVFYLRRNHDVAGTYRETLLRRRYDVLLLGGGMSGFLTQYYKFNAPIYFTSSTNSSK